VGRLVGRSPWTARDALVPPSLPSKQARSNAVRGAAHSRGYPQTPPRGDAGWTLVEKAQRGVLVPAIRPLRLVGFVAAQEIEGALPAGDALLDGVADQDLPDTLPEPTGVHPTLVKLKRLAHREAVKRRDGFTAGLEQEQPDEPLRRQNPHRLQVKLGDSRRQECAFRRALRTACGAAQSRAGKCRSNPAASEMARHSP
jgi:hypothetical protein